MTANGVDTVETSLSRTIQRFWSLLAACVNNPLGPFAGEKLVKSENGTYY